ncbi:TetR/AcrR family transcriptional regulator [Pseudohoeflea coraliihabitans]|uniref:TetR/AcrR family transcriptional regulator n=1 Tax=Pseudohoeflea coraliihabitans TaxID=2860393 RepID=A0ABS6WKY0_9HYPH|nr:TetR/AcrR family transcriptional regulator [Pseudohoeflea sp. DP4N28-3]MBW3095790.1 TetR/AcrR family transcriptional regulator [Pseudohoeflea sp. DP4N28-3]
MARRTGTTGAETAQKLTESALTLFARDGYAAVSMRAIAAKTGIQAGAIYNHFATKQDILKHLLTAHMEALLAAWEAEPEAGTQAPRAALEAFVRFHVRYHLDRHREIYISYMELRNLDDGNFSEIRRMRRAYEAIPRAIIDRGVADGSFSVLDPQVTTMAIIATLNGMSIWYKKEGRLSLDAIEDLHIALVTRMVGATKGTADV